MGKKKEEEGVVVVFTEEGSVGLDLEEQPGPTVAVQLVKEGTQATQHASLRPGLVITHVAGRDMVGRSLDDVFDAIVAHPERPLELRFAADEEEEAEADGGESAAWRTSLSSLLASPASMIFSSRAATDAAADTQPAGEPLPPVTTELWEASEKMLTPSVPGGLTTAVEYPAPTPPENVYEASGAGPFWTPSLELYRVTHDRRPGIGFQPRVVTRATITGVETKHVGGKEHTAYMVECRPTEGFPWSVAKRFSEFVALRTALGTAHPELLKAAFPSKQVLGSLLGSQQAQRATVTARRATLEAWLEAAVEACREDPTLLLFFHEDGASSAAAAGQEEAEPEDGGSPLRELTFVSSVTVAVAVGQSSFWRTAEPQFAVGVTPEFGGEGWTIRRSLSEFTALRAKMIAELEAISAGSGGGLSELPFPVVGWFSGKDTDDTRRARAILLQEWAEGALTLARREPLLLTFLQDDGSTAEEEPVAEPEGEAVLAEYRCLRRCQIRAEAVRALTGFKTLARRQKDAG